MSSDAQVYSGFWINRSGNSITGATLTLQNGAYLVAFLAMLVRTAGKHFWQLLCFALFQLLPQEGIPMTTTVRQLRAVLRNSSSAIDGLMNFVQIGLRSRRAGNSTSWTPISMSILSVINVVGFVLAAIFSSRVTSMDSQVLLVPSTCGIWTMDLVRSLKDWNQETFVHSLELSSLIRRNMLAASQKSDPARNTSHPFDNYGQAGLRPISFTARNITCPFDPAVCLRSGLGLELDTGFVDSYEGLGINTEQAGRVTFRKKLQCSPLRTNGYTQSVSAEADATGTAIIGNTSLTGYYYGANIQRGTNYTFAFNPESFQVSIGSAVQIPSNQIGYSRTNLYRCLSSLQINRVEASAFSASLDEPQVGSSFMPIEGLRKSNVVLDLFFLSKQTAYLSPVDDPWFRANNLDHQSITSSNMNMAKMRLYTSTEPVAVLACREETLLSNTTDGKYTAPMDLVTHLKVKSDTFGLRWSAKQIPIVQRLLYTTAYTSIAQVANSLNGNGLLATAYVQYNMSPGLPQNQWQLELTNWLATSLNALQTFTVQYVTGYGDQDGSVTNIVPPADSEKWICDRQIVHRDDYSSFSVLGLAILIIISGCIILANVSTRRFIAVREKQGKGAERSRVGSTWEDFDILNLTVDESIQRRMSFTGKSDLTPTGSPLEDLKLSTDQHSKSWS